jgi:glucose-6-phosphate isomerase
MLLAHCIAQSRALMVGLPHDDPHRQFSGNRPSVTLVLERADAESVGALLALGEHRAAVAGAMYGVNSFDQFGVELGKVVAKEAEAALQGKVWATDASSAALIERLRS